MKLIKNKVFLIFFFSTILFTIFYDFSSFYSKIFSYKNNNPVGKNIVVLTGGTNRIKQTLNILSSKKNKNFNLLISGAGKGFTKTTVLQLSKKHKISREMIDCCVMIDKKSTDTFSNAKQTKVWIEKLRLRSISLITSNYHMPRSLMIFNTFIYDVKIIPYVLNDKGDNKNIDLDVLLIEYFKFKLAKIRLIF